MRDVIDWESWPDEPKPAGTSDKHFQELIRALESGYNNAGRMESILPIIDSIIKVE